MAHAIAIVLFIGSAPLTAFFVWGVLFPRRFIRSARRFMSGPGVIGATAGRLLLAFLLWFAAPASSTSDAFRAIAVVIFVAAPVPVLLGTARVLRTIDRLDSWPPVATRIPCAVGTVLGAFILWSVSPTVAMF